MAGRVGLQLVVRPYITILKHLGQFFLQYTVSPVVVPSAHRHALALQSLLSLEAHRSARIDDFCPCDLPSCERCSFKNIAY
jgi:hypothetical protein